MMPRWFLDLRIRFAIAKAMKGGYFVVVDDRKRELARGVVHNWKWFFRLKAATENVTIPSGATKVEFFSKNRQLLFRLDL